MRVGLLLSLAMWTALALIWLTGWLGVLLTVLAVLLVAYRLAPEEPLN